MDINMHNTSDVFVNLLDRISVSDSESTLWVFGYGSLCWNPGFDFTKAVKGYIKGYSRKFWQGNITHRGTKEEPGRVATLVKDNKNFVHGVAFQVKDAIALDYLQQRECQLGGYITEATTFFPASGPTLTVILYIATSENSLWLGDAPLYSIAEQIAYSKGPSGYNAEYVLRLANFMRYYFPEEQDDHLFGLEEIVKSYISKNDWCYQTLMGCGTALITFIKSDKNLEDLSEERRDEVENALFLASLRDKSVPCIT